MLVYIRRLVVRLMFSQTISVAHVFPPNQSVSLSVSICLKSYWQLHRYFYY